MELRVRLKLPKGKKKNDTNLLLPIFTSRRAFQFRFNTEIRMKIQLRFIQLPKAFLSRWLKLEKVFSGKTAGQDFLQFNSAKVWYKTSRKVPKKLWKISPKNQFSLKLFSTVFIIEKNHFSLGRK